MRDLTGSGTSILPSSDDFDTALVRTEIWKPSCELVGRKGWSVLWYLSGHTEYLGGSGFSAGALRRHDLETTAWKD